MTIIFSSLVEIMKAALIGIDLGTTVCKGIAVDESLQIITQESRSYPLIHVSAREIEQDATLWWDITSEIISKLVSVIDRTEYHIAGLSISSQGIAFVPVDCNLNPLRHAFSWLDYRSEEQLSGIRHHFNEKLLFQITGKRSSASYVLSKLLWFAENEPELYSRTYKILMPLDFLLAKLTGRCVTDHTMASGTMFYDITKQEWSSEICDSLALETEKFPEILWSGEPVGRIKSEAASMLGLPEDIIISVGGQDQKVAALGAAIDLNRTTVSLGTAMAITQKCPEVVLDSKMRIPCFTDLLREHWVLEGVSSGTSSLDWFKRIVLPDKTYKELDRIVESVRPKQNCPFFFPFFGTSGTPQYVKGIGGYLTDMDYSMETGHLIKGLFEGIGFRIKVIINLMEEINNPVEKFHLFGGGSNSNIWSQIIADITGKQIIKLPTSEAGSIGACILAGIGAGIYKDPEDAFLHIHTTKIYEPDNESVRYYEDRYECYRKVEKNILGN